MVDYFRERMAGETPRCELEFVTADLRDAATRREVFAKAASQGPVLFITGELDNPDRDTAGIEKLKSLGVPAKQVIFKDAKHGCWLQRPWFEQCVESTDAWFKEHMPAGKN